ncbi:hypothetical protein [Sulfobacillus thermosulfidooxidans]|uniref:Uncharacterized protein n=2 Tax=Sulfobacillus thermosulfidooxidans TaxID=28034 RepID=A0A1W1WJK5_SULTA|nr:hypothetical protein [Sulfobacillus thermosulfidooxidans]OLZ08527.1 hypothetical protein BFX05_03070 [Sulfobacillus thermosulfidooxidans]OLZ13129.1 hypothetical protein BFX06_11320 [Sulfobacillus thermosulfidooxidans]OLZ21509.1 hypothetical protein BFX07_11745 [Sulfobacillus thermosulfidooxidans]PSR29205.1 MAG: hypothetical protein C7B47_02465 [Sulfobacillus thermosulfidooxidans]SMC06210.1 hypothetical protein SAMN00768000_2691 [Sulfobacillus thermosulfidooxidans DSM 9293]
MEKSPQAAFVMWVFLTVTTGILWVLLQYGRTLWLHTRTAYIRIAYLQQAGLLSNETEKCVNLEGKETSQEEGDEAKS